MLSREPPRSTVGYLHGERNTPKFRFKDPRNAKRERQNRGKPRGKSIKGGDAGCRCTPTEITSPMRTVWTRQHGRSDVRRQAG